MGSTSIPLDAAQLALLLAAGLGAGLLGALLGVGGGVILVPVLILGFDLPAHVAVATGLVAVVATSSAAGSGYLGRGLTNLRLAMTLEVATTAGALTGGVIAAMVSERVLLSLFSTLLVTTAVLLLVGGEEGERQEMAPGRTAVGYETIGRLAGGFPSPRTGELVHYRARRLPLGLAVSFAAGNVSGLLGVGGGFLKVPAMRLGMGVPTRVAVATSNVMIGVTAAASLVIYVQHGFLYPLVAAPVALGIAPGALFGTRLSRRVPGRLMARLLAVLVLGVAVEMTLRALGIWHV